MGLDIYWGRIDPNGAETKCFRNTDLSRQTNKYSHAALLVKMAKKMKATKTIRRTYHTWNEKRNLWIDPKREHVTVVKYRRASEVNTLYTDGWIEGSAVAYDDLKNFYRDKEKHSRNVDDYHIDYCNIFLTKKADVVKLAGFIGEGAAPDSYDNRVEIALLTEFIEGQDFVLLNW